MKKNRETHWGSVADWYAHHLTDTDSYHAQVVLPNLLRLVAPSKGMRIIDIACGTGYFSRAFAEAGAEVSGVDMSESLLAHAESEMPHGTHLTYHRASAEALEGFPEEHFDTATLVLAIQNIRHAERACAEASRVLTQNGTLHIVMNHPCFRIPKHSSWVFEGAERQYRRIDSYMSEQSVPIDMHPGSDPSVQTLSFHRPLQWYVKHLTKAGFVIDRLEEWISHRVSGNGPRKDAEDHARKEIPLFLYLRARKL